MCRVRRNLQARLDPTYRYGLRTTLFAAALILVVGPFGILLREVTQRGRLTEIDTSAANSLHEAVRESPVLVAFLKAVTFLGSPAWFYVMLGVVVLFLLKKGNRRLAAYVAITASLGGLINTAVKLWVARPRPSLEEPIATAAGNSFPSGHAMASTVGYGLLLLVLLPAVPRRWRPAAIAGTVLLVSTIGFSRLALGVHYITDVLGGFVLGLAWLLAATAAFSIWRVERGRPPVDLQEGIEGEEEEDDTGTGPQAASNLPPA